MSEKDITRLERALEKLTARVDLLTTNIAETNVKLAEFRGEHRGVKWLTGLLAAGGGVGAMKIVELLTGN